MYDAYAAIQMCLGTLDSDIEGRMRVDFSERLTIKVNSVYQKKQLPRHS